MSSFAVQGCFYAEEPHHRADLEPAGAGLLWQLGSSLFFLLFLFAGRFLLLMPTHGSFLPLKGIYQPLQVYLTQYGENTTACENTRKTKSSLNNETSTPCRV